MKKPILKGYYEDIFYEFLLQDNEAHAIYFLPGFPSANNYDDLMRYLYDQGFHVFTIRYRGSYQSKGTFLEKDPVIDLLNFIEHAKKGKTISLWDGQEFSFQTKQNILSASSFGGAVAAGTLAQTTFFDKAIFFAPVWDFSEHNKIYPEQDLQHLTQFTKKAFQNCYRFTFDDIQKEIEKYPSMSKNNFLKKINTPILVFHGLQDNTVRIEHTKNACEQNTNITCLEHPFGHGPKKELLEKYAKQVNSFLGN